MNTTITLNQVFSAAAEIPTKTVLNSYLCGGFTVHTEYLQAGDDTLKFRLEVHTRTASAAWHTTGLSAARAWAAYMATCFTRTESVLEPDTEHMANLITLRNARAFKSCLPISGWGFTAGHLLLPKDWREDYNAALMGDLHLRVERTGSGTIFRTDHAVHTLDIGSLLL